MAFPGIFEAFSEYAMSFLVIFLCGIETSLTESTHIIASKSLKKKKKKPPKQ